ncbi:MAG: flavodoxin FldB [Pontibacterium sp.]
MSHRIGLFYGTTTGNTEDVASLIAECLTNFEVEQHDIAEEGFECAADYQQLIIGIPTWDFGELQEDWADLWETLDEIDFSGRTCALFGLGDQVGYAEWFQDAMGLLHDKLVQRGATMVGYWPNQDYKFIASKALTEDKSHFVGLAIDQDSQSIETETRIATWVAQVICEFELA